MIRRLKILFDWLRARKIRTIDVIVVVVLFVAYMLSVILEIDLNLSLDFNTEIKQGYFCTLDKNGAVYIVDSGQDRLFKVKDKKVEWEIICNDDGRLCQIQNVMVDDGGSIYIHEVCYDESGWNVIREFIHKYDSDRLNSETLYVLNYDEGCNIDRAALMDLKIVDGHLECLKLEDWGFEVLKIVDGEAIPQSKYFFDNAPLFIQRVITSPNNIYILDRRGKILGVDEQGKIYPYYTFKDDVVPFDMVVGSDESLYVTDARSQSVIRISPQKEEKKMFSKQSVYDNGVMLDSNDGVFLHISIKNVTFEDGSQQDVFCGIFGYNTLYVVKQDGEVLYNQSIFEPSMQFFLSSVLNIGVFIIIIVCIVLLGIRFLFVLLFHSMSMNMVFLVEFIMILTTIVISIAILPVTLSSIDEISFGEVAEKTLTLAQTASKNIDADKLRAYNQPKDFMNDDCKDLLKQLRIATFYYDNAEQLMMGGSIEKFIGDMAVDVIYSHIRTGIYLPVDCETKKQILEMYYTGKSNIATIQTLIGKQLIARAPIFDSHNEFVGCVCIQQNMTRVEGRSNSIVRKVACNLMVVIVLLIFIVNEIIVFIQKRVEYRRQKQIKNNLNNTGAVFPYHILRLSNMIFSMSVNMSSGFLPAYLILFYSEYLAKAGIPFVLAASIPLSINIGFVFLASTLALNIFEKFGFKKVIIFAVCCSMVSDIMLATVDTYEMITLALLLNGWGYGLLLESKRSYLSKLSYDKLNSVQIFCSSGENAGKFLGLFVGGFAVVLLVNDEIIKYNMIFWLSVLIDIIALGFCIYFCKTYSGSKRHSVDEKETTHYWKLLLKKEVLCYLVSIPVIWGIIAGFVGYYIPMYGNLNGFLKNEISLSFVAVGIIPVFFSLNITKFVIKKFGRNSIYIAILIALTAIILIVNFKQLVLFASSLFILGIAYSFGLGVCRYRFSQMDEVKKFGQNRAQSIYNLFFAIGSTLSPLIFGFIWAPDMSIEVGVLAVIIVVIVGVYRIVFDRKNAN